MARWNIYLLISLSIFFLFSIYLYNTIDSRSADYGERQKFVANFEKKISSLEKLANENGQTINRLENELSRLQNEKKIANNDKDEGDIVGQRNRLDYDQVKTRAKTTPANANICEIRSNISSPSSDLQMLDLYDTWKFENKNGGDWRQGWEITYNEEDVKNEEMLEVIVIPHSHCDPGWLKTFEEYYESQTRNILDGMAKHVGEKDELKFIYAEMSFFEMWWRSQTEEIREKVKRYIKEGKFEIVTGGWVMTDEANAHYHSIVVELFEGHEWIMNHLGEQARPVSHWSIDPFGLSPSVPHLLTSANITNAVIQRVHYAVKRELARKKSLEFYWRQLFSQSSHPDMRSHMMPFYSYDAPHSCGPDPAICCQFDFRRVPEGRFYCPWGKTVKVITAGNVEERAEALYDQYRKKSQLYANNVILVPLGDDFRYDIDFEWNTQYNNYKKLFEYMNSQPNWNVHARFGTVKDYFEVLDKKLEKSGHKLETLSGDFFTYADRDDHYWSGYFTSRPFYKQLDRVLQHYLRSAEIAFTLSSIEESGVTEVGLFEKLVLARRALALFQHHDGVTGTAKDRVVIDYGMKMIEAIVACEDVLSESLISVLGLDTTKKMKLEEYRENESILPERHVYSVGENVVLFNTLSRNRDEPVCILVNTISAGIKSISDKTRQQISPLFVYDEDKGKIVKRVGVYELCFSIHLGPMSTASLKIVNSDSAEKANISVIGNIEQDSAFNYNYMSRQDFSINNGLTKIEFSAKDGMVKAITSSVDSNPVVVKANFVRYSPRDTEFFTNGNMDNPPGAYLFLPKGEAKEIPSESQNIVVIDGILVKRVLSLPIAELKTMQVYSIYDGLPYLDMDTEIDIRNKIDQEVSIRFSSNINSQEDFYTDLNGLQMIRRRRQTKLPLQANYYPMSAGVFIEDKSTRLSIHSAQALGVSSLKSGQIEIMLERRLSTDDARGVEQGVLDNKRTVSHMRILVEPMNSGGHSETERVGFHSAVSHFATVSLHYPIVKMVGESTPRPVLIKNFEEEMNCDYHIVTLRTISAPTKYLSAKKWEMKAENKAAMIVHRVVPDCRSKLELKDDSCSRSSYKIAPKTIIPLLKSARNSSLTAMYEGDVKDMFELNPNDVSTILVDW